MEYVLRTYDLVKKYKNQYALNKVNMTISKGDIYGFVGENGSGKTTIIRTITGLIFPNSGSFELFGIGNTNPKINEVKRKLSAVVETPSIYNNFSAYENLKNQSIIIGINDDNKIKEVLETVGLADLINDKKHAGDFSLGMRQRLGIAMALLSDPEFLILDEPMNGLDPKGIVEIRELILKLNKEKNITFLISSHILTELALVANKYGIISKGKMIKEITNEELRKVCRKSLTITVSDINKAYEVISKIHNEHDIITKQNSLTVYGDFSINNITSNIIKSNIEITSILSNETNIEDYYLSLIRGEYND